MIGFLFANAVVLENEYFFGRISACSAKKLSQHTIRDFWLHHKISHNLRLENLFVIVGNPHFD